MKAGMMGGVIVAESIKLRSVRSTYIALACAVVLGVAIGLLDTSSIVANWAAMTADQQAGFDAVGDPLSGFLFGELAFGVLGVLAVTTEYQTGMIRTTFTAVPRRRTVFVAKGVVVGSLSLVAGEAFVFVTFFVCQPVLASRELDTTLGDPGVLRALSCAGLYLFVVTMVGFGLGALIRHSAGAIAVLFGLVYLAYPVGRAIEGWSYLPDRWLLANAADVVAATHLPAHSPRLPSFELAVAVLSVYLVMALALGAWRCSRDA